MVIKDETVWATQKAMAQLFDVGVPAISKHIKNIFEEGELPGGYDETVLYGKHSSKPRNRNIAGAMFKAGFIDTWGRGFKKIREGFEKASMPMPKVENFCGGVQVTIERTKFMQMTNVGGNVGGGVGDEDYTKLTERQEGILNLIKENAHVSANEMSEVLSVTQRTIERDLAAMQKKRVIIREGNVKSGRWVVIKG